MNPYGEGAFIFISERNRYYLLYDKLAGFLKVGSLYTSRCIDEDLDLALHIHEVGGKIRRDDKLIVYTSSRRIRNNPKSFFGEYPMRFVNTLISHGHPIPIPHKLLKILKSA
jgi:hypothetical protein